VYHIKVAKHKNAPAYYKTKQIIDQKGVAKATPWIHYAEPLAVSKHSSSLYFS
jgi:hypothetical protein